MVATQKRKMSWPVLIVVYIIAALLTLFVYYSLRDNIYATQVYAIKCTGCGSADAACVFIVDGSQLMDTTGSMTTVPYKCGVSSQEAIDSCLSKPCEWSSREDTVWSTIYVDKWADLYYQSVVYETLKVVSRKYFVLLKVFQVSVCLSVLVLSVLLMCTCSTSMDYISSEYCRHVSCGTTQPFTYSNLSESEESLESSSSSYETLDDVSSSE